MKFCPLQEKNFCFVRFKVKPTERTKTENGEATYDGFYYDSSGEVHAGFCPCKGGSDGYCRHVAIVLFDLNNMPVTMSIRFVKEICFLFACCLLRYSPFQICEWMNVFQLVFKRLYNISGREMGTLRYFREKLQRRNVTQDVKHYE